MAAKPDYEEVKQDFVGRNWITEEDAPTCLILDAGPIEYWSYRGYTVYYFHYSYRLRRTFMTEGLSNLALHVMHHIALEKNIPIDSLSEQLTKHRLDRRLNAFKALAITGSSISPGTYSSIKREFVHHSVNYETEYPIIGSPMKAGVGNIRTIHANDPSKAD